MDRNRKKTPVCRQFEADLYHFQAGELPEAEMAALAEHAEACPPCGRRLDVEAGLLRGLKGRLERAEAPPELRARVRRALATEAPPSRFRGWLRSRWLVPAVAALLLAVMMLPVMPTFVTLAQVDQEAIVVDYDCERAGKTLEQQRLCQHPEHLNALRVAPERYWNIGLDRQVGRSLAAQRGLRGHRLRVVGELNERKRTLHLAHFTDQGIAALSTGLIAGPLPGS